MLKRHLAIDIGAESGRAIVGWVESGKWNMKEIHRFITKDIYLRDKKVRNIYRYYEEIVNALRIFAEEFGTELYSVGVDAWGSDFVLLDEAGNIRKVPMSYRECEIGNTDAYIRERYGAKKIYMRTGNQIMQRDTLHQLLSMCEEERNLVEASKAILFIADIFHYFLCGRICCEHSLASFSHIFNRKQNEWDVEIMQALNVPLSLQTEVVCSAEILGEVSYKLCAEVGISTGVKVITPCSHDTANAAFAVPDKGEEWMFISSGTWSLVGIETESAVINKESYSFNLSNSSMGLGSNMLQKIMSGMWIIQQCHSSWKEYTYDQIVHAAAQEADCEFYIDPDDDIYFASENMPVTVCNKLKKDYGVNIEPDEVGKIAYIFFQSIALKYNYVLKKIAEITEKKVEKIYMIGGGSKNSLINRFTANVTGIPVYSGMSEATAVGNLLLQAYGSGEFQNRNELKQILVDTFKLTEFVPQEMERWKNKYQQFIESEVFVANW